MTGPQNIWLCRHGNRIDRIDRSQRGPDPRLSEDGIVQARETGQRLLGENIRYIFASPFLRTVETAHYIAETLNLSVKIEAGLGEWLNAEWFHTQPELHSRIELRRRFARIDDTYHSIVIPTYPEDAQQASERAGRAARILADRFKSNVLFVGHGHSVMGMATALLGQPCSAPCYLCGLFKFSRNGPKTTLELAGDASHLSSGSLI